MSSRSRMSSRAAVHRWIISSLKQFRCSGRFMVRRARWPSTSYRKSDIAGNLAFPAPGSFSQYLGRNIPSKTSAPIVLGL